MDNIRVLIVDDDSPMRAFIKAGIRSTFTGRNGIIVELDEAGSVEGAMARLSERPYDIVLCDWNLPGMKGTELLSWVKGEDKQKDILFVMLTAHNEEKIVKEAIDMGVNDFITKPITVNVLTKRLMSAIRTILDLRSNKSHDII
ncbi:MAG: response regulator [Syntrophobacteraceae bacterium]